MRLKLQVVSTSRMAAVAGRRRAGNAPSDVDPAWDFGAV